MFLRSALMCFAASLAIQPATGAEPFDVEKWRKEWCNTPWRCVDANEERLKKEREAAKPIRRVTIKELREQFKKNTRFSDRAMRTNSYLSAFTVSKDEAIKGQSDQTTLTYSEAHGTQVEFSGADGTLFLWYPGNPVIRQGTWRAGEQETRVSMEKEILLAPIGMLCFAYGENTFNPATGHVGSGAECIEAGRRETDVLERRSGDVFGLAGHSDVPFVLKRDKTTIDELLQLHAFQTKPPIIKW